jgi:serine/threonine protein kinase
MVFCLADNTYLDKDLVEQSFITNISYFLEPYVLILEYLAGGDLLGYLRKSRGHKDSYSSGEYVPTSKLNEKNLLSFAWMIADGMAYLAQNEVMANDRDVNYIRCFSYFNFGTI